MELWLGTESDKIRFPILPTSLGVDRSVDISTEGLVKRSEIPIFNGQKLKTIKIDSFFPNQEYSFCDYKGFMKPYDFAYKLQKWMQDNTVLRVIVTDTPTNMQCTISDFSTREQDGTRDLYFELTLIEYRNVDVPQVTNSNSNNSNSNNQRPTTSKPSTTQKKHKVKKGDNLWDIAKKYYGKGSLFTKIQQANISKYPSLDKTPSFIKDGWELIIP